MTRLGQPPAIVVDSCSTVEHYYPSIFAQIMNPRDLPRRLQEYYLISITNTSEPKTSRIRRFLNAFWSDRYSLRANCFSSFLGSVGPRSRLAVLVGYPGAVRRIITSHASAMMRSRNFCSGQSDPDHTAQLYTSQSRVPGWSAIAFAKKSKYLWTRNRERHTEARRPELPTCAMWQWLSLY